MAANILNHRPFQNIEYHLVGDTKIADECYSRGVFIPSYAMSDDEEIYYFDVLEKFLEKY